MSDRFRAIVMGIGCTGCGVISYLHGKGFRGAELSMLNKPENISADYVEVRSLRAGYTEKNLNSSRIEGYLKDTDMIFVIAEIGEPYVDEIVHRAMSMGILTLFICIRHWEDSGIMNVNADSIIMLIHDGDYANVYAEAYGVIQSAIYITDNKGDINIDFSHVKNTLSSPLCTYQSVVRRGSGKSISGALLDAAFNPMIPFPPSYADKIIVNVASKDTLPDDELSCSESFIRKIASNDSSVIWGTVIDQSINDDCSVIIIASYPFCHNVITVMRK
ncbi:MAG: hypothetical protein IJM68_02050 [Synergistaceae bacterium]|nr:hypothetical protein [Synergistaceae bacterium]